MVEGARLESVYTPKGYRGFESLPLCKRKSRPRMRSGFLFSEYGEAAGLKPYSENKNPSTYFGCCGNSMLAQDTHPGWALANPTGLKPYSENKNPSTYFRCCGNSMLAQDTHLG